MDRPVMDPRTMALAISKALYDQSNRYRTAVEKDLAAGKARAEREATMKHIGTLLARACNVGMARLAGDPAADAQAERELKTLRASLRADPALRAAMQAHLPLLAATPKPGAPRLAPVTREVLTAALLEEAE
ncbi:MAG TPA: hypothetical protein VF613_09730 [Longimicrobium sp.]|jgi:hypothetical protein